MLAIFIGKVGTEFVGNFCQGRDFRLLETQVRMLVVGVVLDAVVQTVDVNGELAQSARKGPYGLAGHRAHGLHARKAFSKVPQLQRVNNDCALIHAVLLGQHHGIAIFVVYEFGGHVVEGFFGGGAHGMQEVRCGWAWSLSR